MLSKWCHFKIIHKVNKVEKVLKDIRHKWHDASAKWFSQKNNERFVFHGYWSYSVETQLAIIWESV